MGYHSTLYGNFNREIMRKSWVLGVPYSQKNPERKSYEPIGFQGQREMRELDFFGGFWSNSSGRMLIVRIWESIEQEMSEVRSNAI